ncbi:MAG: TIGR00730 family Rossman fold protein, partial [Rectinemataceae bacterium]
IPRRLFDLVEQPELAELLVTADMHERKARMAELSDAFIALPGGTGTLEELFEAWTWRQIGYHAKPLGLLEVEGYWEPLLAFIRHASEEGFINPSLIPDLVVRRDAEELFEALEKLEAPLAKLPERQKP